MLGIEEMCRVDPGLGIGIKSFSTEKTEEIGRKEGKGFYYVMEFFNISRVFVAAQSLGIAQGAFQERR